ncbi:MAG: hypothetical protein NUV69_05010 [Candidatus Curtissbacteria bacterium]|nr:hypothetical protein [Candidatus Curtissbacteria bacterium]
MPLAIFSYSYVDLNLTLSQNPLALSIISTLQQLGYFNRQSATFIFIFSITTVFCFFAYNLWLFKKGKISANYLKVATIGNTIILIFAYPFLSSDIFNYMFDAKIITQYHANPYTHKPLDFPSDEWIRFMRWVHRYSPYGPLWLVMSTIPSILGFGKFITTLFAFKISIGIFHLVNSYLIYRILKITNPKALLLGTAFYAMNPLFLIEGVANGHNDLILATFLLASIFLFTSKRYSLSLITLLAGALVKYIPILNLPWLIWAKLTKQKNVEKLIFLNLLTMIAFTIIFSTTKISTPFVSSGATQVQFQPWYLFWTVPYVSLLAKKELILAAFIVCYGAMLRYLPFLYYGDWSQPGTTTFMKFSILIPLIIAAVISVIPRFSKR